jgi:hypothetical protein
MPPYPPVLIWNSKLFTFPTGKYQWENFTNEQRKSVNDVLNQVNTFVGLLTSDSDVSVDNPVIIEIQGSESNIPATNYPFVKDTPEEELFTKPLAGLRSAMINNRIRANYSNINNGISLGKVKIDLLNPKGGTVEFDKTKYDDGEGDPKYVKSLTDEQYVEIKIFLPTPTDQTVICNTNNTAFAKDYVTPPSNCVGSYDFYSFPDNFISGVMSFSINSNLIPDAFKIQFRDENGSPTKTILIPPYVSVYYLSEVDRPKYADQLVPSKKIDKEEYLLERNPSNPYKKILKRDERGNFIANPNYGKPENQPDIDSINKSFETFKTIFVKRIKEMVEAYNTRPNCELWKNGTGWTTIIVSSTVNQMKTQLKTYYPKFSSIIDTDPYFNTLHSKIPIFFYDRSADLKYFKEKNLSIIQSNNLYIYDLQNTTSSGNVNYDLGNFSFWVKKLPNERFIEITSYAFTNNTKYNLISKCYNKSTNASEVLPIVKQKLQLDF